MPNTIGDLADPMGDMDEADVMSGAYTSRETIADLIRQNKKLKLELAKVSEELATTKSKLDAKQEVNTMFQKDDEMDRRYWQPDEHQRFLVGLKKFGHKDMKAISQHVGTRTTTQVRTHAQKYFMKLSKNGKSLTDLGLPDRPVADFPSSEAKDSAEDSARHLQAWGGVDSGANRKPAKKAKNRKGQDLSEAGPDPNLGIPMDPSMFARRGPPHIMPQAAQNANVGQFMIPHGAAFGLGGEQGNLNPAMKNFFLGAQDLGSIQAMKSNLIPGTPSGYPGHNQHQAQQQSTGQRGQQQQVSQGQMQSYGQQGLLGAQQQTSQPTPLGQYPTAQQPMFGQYYVP